MLYSHSRLATFINCPLKFRFQYIDKAKAVLEKGIEAFLGTMAHDALEKLYTALKFQNILTLDELIGYYNQIWKKNWNKEIVIVRKDYTQENYRRMGEEFLKDYYKKYYPFDQGRTIALEKRVTLKLDPEGKYRLQGYIDRLTDKGDGTYEIHDYKTNSSLPIEEYMKEDRQLALYALAIKGHYPDVKRIRLVWHFLAFDKEWVLEKTDKELEDLRKDTIELIKKVEKEEEFKPRPTKLCDWCQYRPMCPEFKHLYKTEQMPPNKFLKEPGVELVNRYADLKTRKDKLLEEIDTELDKIKEAMVEKCKKEGLTVLAGSDHNAKVWMAKVSKFPGKNDEGRFELEEEIKKSGKWRELSMLDTFLLSRMMQAGELPEGLVKKLHRLGKMEEISRVYLRKIPERG